jgi:hypothetical protein
MILFKKCQEKNLRSKLEMPRFKGLVQETYP